MDDNVANWFVGFDPSAKCPDYTSLSLTDSIGNVLSNQIIRTDNPDTNFWLKFFLENEQETKEQEPSDKNRREHNLRNAEEDRCV